MLTKKIVSMSLLLGVGLSLTVISCKKDSNNLRSKTYPLTAVFAGATGTVTISENADKSFNIKVLVDKSVRDTLHLVKLYSGSLTTPNAIALPLSTIVGTGNTASAETASIKQIKLPANSMKNVTYDSIINYKAFIKVFHSTFRGDSLIAKGNIGSN